MEVVGKHAWGTPKCGISLIKNIFAEVEKPDSKYVFLLARNPFHRLVSIYAEKAIDVNGRFARENEIDEKDYVARGHALRKQASSVTMTGKIDSIAAMSFKDFIMAMEKEWLDEHLNQHIQKQSKGYPGFKFDDVIWLEDLPHAMAKPVQMLGLDVDCSEENLRRLGGTDKGDTHATPRKQHLEMIKEPWDLPAFFWWEEKAMPRNYDVMFNTELKQRVFELYREDFVYFAPYGLKP